MTMLAMVMSMDISLSWRACPSNSTANAKHQLCGDAIVGTLIHRNLQDLWRTGFKAAEIWICKVFRRRRRRILYLDITAWSHRLREAEQFELPQFDCVDCGHRAASFQPLDHMA